MVMAREKTGWTASYESDGATEHRQRHAETAARMEYLLTFDADKSMNEAAVYFREAKEEIEGRIKSECGRLDEMLGKGQLTHADHRKVSSQTMFDAQMEQSANDDLERLHRQAVDSVRNEQSMLNESPAAYLMASAVIAHELDDRLRSDGAVGVLESSNFDEGWRKLLDIAGTEHDGKNIIGNPDFDRKIWETVAGLRRLEQLNYD